MRDSRTKFSGDNRLLDQLKDHVVQLETLVVFLVVVNVSLFLVSEIKPPLPVWVVPCALLILVRPLMRVMNPTDKTRNRIVWAAVGAGILGPVGGAIDLASFGLTAGAGTAMGMSLGAAIGGALGDKIEKWRDPKALLERGAAFDYLYAYRSQNPRLANPRLINKALDRSIPHFDKNEDGRKWYTVDDLNRFANKRK